MRTCLGTAVDAETMRRLHEELNRREEQQDKNKGLPKDDFADAMRAQSEQKSSPSSPIADDMMHSLTEAMVRKRMVGSCPACGRS